MIFFTKMQANGNDFIIIDTIKQKINYNIKILSKYLCNRNLSIGADGVVFLAESKIADYKMRIFNSDGTEAEMCGNGISCLAKYINKNYKKESKIKIETLKDIKQIKIEKNEISVNIGKPITEPLKIPVFLPNTYNRKIQTEKIEIENEEIQVYFLSIGNPHSVCFVENIDNIELEKYGKFIENYKFFPNKTNVEFVQIINKNEIKIRVWERGVGETLSCGTGACASAYISIKEKGLNKDLKVKFLGGILNINLNEKEEIILKGTAQISFEGKIENL